MFRPCRRADLRIEVGLKYALSRNMDVVLSVTPEFIPPNTPAIHIGFSASHIIRSASESLRSMPSSVTNGVPSGQLRTTMRPPLTLSRSKQCSGWPMPCRM